MTPRKFGVDSGGVDCDIIIWLDGRKSTTLERDLMDTDKRFKFLIWGGFALVIGAILAWPVVKRITTSASPEVSFPEGAESAPDLPMPLRYQSAARYEAGTKTPGYTARRPGAGEQPAAQTVDISRVISSGYDNNREDQPAQSSGRQREADFIRTHAVEIMDYQARLNILGLKYMAKYPALRRMDADFAKMGRYMKLKKQFEKDLDAYSFARGMTALPEVRAAIIRYSANPEVVMGLMAAALEAVKNPPPQAIQAEVANFFAENPIATSYVNDVLVQAMGNAMPTISSIPGQDLATLQKIGSGVLGGSTLKRR